MASSGLEAFVNSIRNMHQLSNVNYTEIFNAINSNLDAFSENAPNLLDNVLPVFTLPEYTLPHMSVLFAISSSQQQQQQNQAANSLFKLYLNAAYQDKFILAVENCIQRADCKQIEVAMDVYSDLCHFLVNKLIHSNRPKQGLLVIRTAIGNLQTSSNSAFKPNLLTTVHSDLLQLCLASKNFKLGLDLISNEILDILKPQSSNFDAKYLISYFYYAGCIYGAMKQYESALFYLEQALTVPASVLSQIMIEAYKKFILISLISKGKLPTLPKYTSRIVINQIKPICSIYHELASAFTNFDLDKLNSLVHKYHDLLHQDRNYGLVKQLQQSFYKKNIQKLTKTFITLSLADMALKVKLTSAREAETYMLNMIKDGEIFATINQKDGMVSFHDNPEKYDNPLIMEQLTNQMFSCIQMDSNIKEMDKEITTHPHYIQKCQNNSTVDDNTDQLLQSSNISSLRQQQSSNNLMI